jgi:hypothetical protein
MSPDMTCPFRKPDSALHGTVNLVSVVSVTLRFRLLVFVLLSAFKSRGRLAAENIVLRQQLIILRRRHRGRTWLNGADRALLSSLVRLAPPFSTR